ncbi:Telomere length regulator rif1 [Lecanosticta acicola]|uniref:Telomere length regulator rif1 n=1 Tax=Lecanosticta acicola TaxID=111012 RepID=A0AAI9E7X0_9PEZI|nr:Telomere length regulator rif1 [Lecanosticta acicola]
MRPSADTPPPRSPASSQTRDSTNTKKVDFSPWPTYHKISQPGQTGPHEARISKQTPLRRDSKPLKSILKPASEPLPPTPDELESKLSYFSPQEPGSFRRMLQSILGQLGSTSRDNRRDAYLVLTGAIRQYEGVPDPEAIIDKLGLLQQFISRDLQWKGADGRLDTSIVSQALTLTGMLIFNSDVATAFDSDFQEFLVDRSIAIIEQGDVSKAIVKNHMYLMSQQRFGPAIMTPARADRLVNAVQGIEERCKGNSLISARLIIFQRLIDSVPNTMLHRMRDWMEHVFHGLLSSVDDIRTRAIETCSHAGIRLGTQPSATKVLLEMFDKNVDESEDGQTYGDYFNFRLIQMTAAKELAPLVPQIWGAMILFFRCKRKPLEKWPRIKEWLLTIQKCLNSSDLEVKHQANIAWNKLVFAVMPDSSTAETMRSMLRVPISVAFDKRGNDRLSQQQRQIAMDSYCNLLHYGLRPSLSHEELDAAWDLYVDPILSSMAGSRSKGQHNACRILQGLFGKSNGVWNVNAALEREGIKPEDLPRLDPRWLRTRLARVLRILERILVAGMWTMPDSNKAADGCWGLLLQALAEAGSQEVKTSNELKDAIAQITNLFRRIWSAQSPRRSEVDSSVWMQRYESLLALAVEALGSSHFVEDVLAKTETDEIEAAPTPSHRHSKHSTPAYPAFVFLFALYYQPRSEIKASGLYKKSAAWFLRLLGRSKTSASSNMALLYRSLQFASDVQTDLDVSSQVWSVLAESAIDGIKVTAPASPRDAQIMGNTLSWAIKIFVDGLRCVQFPYCSASADELYTAICQAAKHHGHDGGVALGVMEPLSKLLTPRLDEMPLSSALFAGQVLLQNGVWPKNRQELDQSRKALWTISLELHKSPVFDPFQHVYNLFVGVTDRAYKHVAEMDTSSLQALSEFMSSSIPFFRRCPHSILPVALRQAQNGFAVWVEDRQRSIFPLCEGDAPSTFDRHCIFKVWSELLHLVEGLPRKDSTLLESLEPLLIAGLSSPSKDIVNKSLSFWNSTFGEEASLDYPSRIVPVLRARKAETEVRLPGLPDDNNAEVAVLPAFAESQVGPRAVSDVAFSSSPRVSPGVRKRPLVDNFLIKQHLAAQGLPYDDKSRSSKSAGESAKPKLRHDDSQIDFAPIEASLPSSPAHGDQLLTERQKEVKTRQQGDAQMFPGLSSSPNAQSSARGRRIAKKLDFISDVGDNDEEAIAATPPAPLDGNLMSDDLPSSPTPRAQAGARTSDDTGAYDDNEEDDNETIVDPPSSPPRREASPVQNWVTGPDDTTVVESTAVCGSEQGQSNPSAQVSAGQDIGDRDAECDARPLVATTSDLPSDTQLPTVQLEREAAAAEAQKLALVDTEQTVGESTDTSHKHWTYGKPKKTFEDEIREVEEVARKAATNKGEKDGDELTSSNNTPRSLSKRANASPNVSRISESILQPTEGDNEPASQTSPANTLGSSLKGKKRKRTDQAESRSEPKRSKPSPFKRFFSNLVGSQQEAEEEDDIDDEIVVTISRPRTSPLPKREPEEEPTSVLSRQGGDSPVVQVKRKRGRPRKVVTEENAKRKPGQPKGSGSRQSSQPSTTSDDNGSSVSVVRDTPAPANPRKSARLSQDASADSSSRRVAATQPEDDVEEQDEEVVSPDQQLAMEQSAAERRIAQPKSILGRLRGVLDDCKKMVFGSVEEERQFDDMLFEIRREVHDAGRRTRER